jgi:HTH-type transcriptional regulator/antitoxin HipB
MKFEQLSRSPSQLAAAIRRKRKELKITQEKLGEMTGLRQATIYAVEAGEPGTKIDTIFKILAALDMELVSRNRTKGSVQDIEDMF